VLSSDDFALIERLKEAYAKYVRDPRRRGGKGKLALADAAAVVGGAAYGGGGDGDDPDGAGHSAPAFAVTPEALAPQAKTRKTSKIERIARILEGRKENKFEHEGHAGGLTNKEKKRKKNFVMVRKGKREVANKIRISNSTARWNSNNRVRSVMIIFAFFFFLSSYTIVAVFVYVHMCPQKEQYGRDRRKRRRT
jgi:hypothetical protein